MNIVMAVFGSIFALIGMISIGFQFYKGVEFLSLLFIFGLLPLVIGGVLINSSLN